MTKNMNFVPYSMKITELRITSYDKKVLCGTLESPFFSEVQTFESLPEMLFLVEQMQDETGYPEQTVQLRSFSVAPGERKRELDAAASTGAVLATFRLFVFYRQNATWQGNLHWMERDEVANFRSVYELIKLMDNALCAE